jgi:uncharacterized protein YecE (DUF72 family)
VGGTGTDDFVVAVKASRYLTHVRRLKEPSEPVARLMAAATGLGPKLGPVLLQLPPNLRRDDEALARALGQFPNGVRVAVETRHDSWHDDRTREVLEAYGAAWVWVDPGNRDRPRWRTADWGYVRFHRGAGPAGAVLYEISVADVGQADSGGVGWRRRVLLLQQRHSRVRPARRPPLRGRRVGRWAATILGATLTRDAGGRE